MISAPRISKEPVRALVSAVVEEVLSVPVVAAGPAAVSAGPRVAVAAVVAAGAAVVVEVEVAAAAVVAGGSF